VAAYRRDRQRTDGKERQMHSRRRYQYDNRIGLLGLALGVAILAVGFLTHHGEQASGIAMAVLFLSIGAAYRRVDE
jgi:hypothetical protein